jgi:hypothetical protein
MPLVHPRQPAGHCASGRIELARRYPLVDACLHLLRLEHGAAVANAVARRMVVPPHRDGGQAQYVTPLAGDAGEDGGLVAVHDWALAHLQLEMPVGTGGAGRPAVGMRPAQPAEAELDRRDGRLRLGQPGRGGGLGDSELRLRRDFGVRGQVNGDVTTRRQVGLGAGRALVRLRAEDDGGHERDVVRVTCRGLAVSSPRRSWVVPSGPGLRDGSAG